MKCLFLFVIALVSCTTPTNPNALPPGADWLEPVPTDYAALWQDTEACSGLTGELASVRWIVYRHANTLPGVTLVARTRTGPRTIELIEFAVHQPLVVRHEMLHMLLGPDAEGQHPALYFTERCGALVAHGVEGH